MLWFLGVRDEGGGGGGGGGVSRRLHPGEGSRRTRKTDGRSVPTSTGSGRRVLVFEGSRGRSPFRPCCPRSKVCLQLTHLLRHGGTWLRTRGHRGVGAAGLGWGCPSAPSCGFSCWCSKPSGTADFGQGGGGKGGIVTAIFVVGGDDGFLGTLTPKKRGSCWLLFFRFGCFS